MLAETLPGQAPGLRRSTPAARAAAALADGYRGLADGITRWRLAAALRAAARPLGLSEPMLRLLEHYVDLSYDEDWTAGSEPVITRPLVEIAEHLGKSERQVRNIERALVERGLLAWRDSGNHHRRGRRDRKTGRLVYAYGPSLAPLGARACEIVALAERARRDVAEARRLRIALSALRRRIRSDLAAAAEAGLETEDLAAAFATLPDRAPAGLGPAALEARRAVAADLAERLSERLGRRSSPAEAAKVSPEPEISGRRYTGTCNQDAMNGGIAEKPAKRAPVATPATGARTETDSGLSHIPLALALAAAGPDLTAAAARRGPPSWRGLVEAAREIAPFVEVDAALWGEACGALGRNGAALAVLLLERAMMREPGGGAPVVLRPRAWFRSLLTRAAEGRLHLDRSVRALAAQPARRP